MCLRSAGTEGILRVLSAGVVAGDEPLGKDHLVGFSVVLQLRVQKLSATSYECRFFISTEL